MGNHGNMQTSLSVLLHWMKNDKLGNVIIFVHKKNNLSYLKFSLIFETIKKWHDENRNCLKIQRSCHMIYMILLIWLCSEILLLEFCFVALYHVH